MRKLALVPRQPPTPLESARDAFKAQLARLQQSFGMKSPQVVYNSRTHAVGHRGAPRWESDGVVPWGKE